MLQLQRRAACTRVHRHRVGHARHVDTCAMGMYALIAARLGMASQMKAAWLVE